MTEGERAVGTPTLEEEDEEEVAVPVVGENAVNEKEVGDTSPNKSHRGGWVTVVAMQDDDDEAETGVTNESVRQA